MRDSHGREAFALRRNLDPAPGTDAGIPGSREARLARLLCVSTPGTAAASRVDGLTSHPHAQVIAACCHAAPILLESAPKPSLVKATPTPAPPKRRKRSL